MDLFIGIFVLFIGLVSGTIGAMVGGGGLISIPGLILAGIPPNVSIATNKLGALGLNIFSFIRYNKAKKIVWSYATILSIFAVIGGIIGSIILVNTSNEHLGKVTGIVILIIAPLLLIQKDRGLKRFKITKLKKNIGHFLYFLLMVLGGFFGGGVGILRTYVMVWFYGFTFIESNATHKVPWFFLTIVSTVIFAYNGLIDYLIGGVLFIGMAIGGYLGAHIAVKKGDKLVRIVFILLVVASAIKILMN